MLVQDPLSGYLHEVPDQPRYGGYYGGYAEYIDPSMAEYPREMGHFGFLPFLSPIVDAVKSVVGGGAAPPPPPPAQVLPPAPGAAQPMLPQQMMFPSAGGVFVPPPGLRAYIVSVVREALAELEPGAPAYAPGGGGFRRRRRRR